MVEIEENYLKKLEEIYRQFLKGTIMERKLAYNTVREQIIRELKIDFGIFCENFRKEKK